MAAPRFLSDLAGTLRSQFRIKLAGALGAPTIGAHFIGEEHVDSAGARWYCTVSGTPGTWRSVFFQDTPQVVTASAPITSDRVKFTGSTVNQTLTLPAGVSGTDCFIRNAGNVAVTVARAGADTIEGLTTFVLQPGEAISLTCVGTDWTIF